MIEDGNIQRKAIGNLCQTFHRDRLPLRPRFLRRNLRDILDSHEKLLRRNPDEPPYEDMIANEKRNWGWDFPTTAMLEDFMNGDKPILQLESLLLRSSGPKASIKRRAREHQNESNGLDWLPDPQTDAIWPCTVGVAVWNVQNSKRQVHIESLPAKILQSQSDGRSTEFHVRLDKPFFIELNKLHVVMESGNNGSRSWKRTATTSYLLEITIQCQDSDDSAEFLSRLEEKDASAYEAAPGSEGVLKATWEKLPTCPRDGELLTLRRAKGHKSLELDYKLEIAMGWINRRDYRLKSYNKVFEAKKQDIRQLPTPSASDDMEKTAKRYSIIWKFRDSSATRTLTTKSLSCPLCRDDRDYVYFERLMLHCKNHHSHFHFEAEYTADKPDLSIFHATVSMSVAAQTLEKQNGEEEKEINWVAPNRPFNLKAHIHGLDDWTGQVRSKSRKGSRKHSKDRSFSSAPLPQPSRKRSAPAEVEDLPQHTPKRHCVPHVPGVSFYRTTSKQLIQPGEYIAQSDDDVDESWLSQNQGRALDDLGITGAAKDFTRAFNQHLACEQSDSSILVRDALIRFARSYKDELKDIEWQRLFRAKLNQLRAVGIIGDDIVSARIRILPTAQEVHTSAMEAKAASAGAENDAPDRGTRRASDALEQQKHINGASMNSHQGGAETPNVGRSTSPENGRLVPRERKRWTGGKTVLRERSLPNGDATPNARDSPKEGRGTPNGVATYQDHDTNGVRTTAPPTRSQTCICGKPAKDARGSIACADPVCFDFITQFVCQES